METIDIQKLMGAMYFRQMDAYRHAINSKTGVYDGKDNDLLPPDVVKILFKQRTQSDATEWFTKKAFSKPI